MAKKQTRPLKKIDERQVKELASIQCTMIEMAAVLDCSVDTLERRFADVIKNAREMGKASLKRKQFQVAMSGNVGMLIWLGKILLGQKDLVEHTVKAAQSEETKMQIANMYGRIESMARELKMKHIPQQPEQGLLVESCPTPQAQS